MKGSTQLKHHKLSGIRILTGMAALLAYGALFLFFCFLLAGPFPIIETGLEDSGTLLLNTVLSLIFFCQHSCMLRRAFRHKLARVLPPPYHGLLYATASGITLLLVLTCWQPLPVLVAVSPVKWLPYLTFFLSAAGLVWGAKSLKSFDAVGKKKLMAHLRGIKPPHVRIAIRGPYRYVRHPFYFLIIVMIWSCPAISVDRLLFNCLWTLWIIIGTVLEDRDLALEFGREYREYQRKVPMLVPWKGAAKSTT